MPRRKTNAQFIAEMVKLVGTEYSFIEDYINNKTKIMVIHNLCGGIYKVRPDNFIHGYRCPYCFGTPKKSNVSFMKELSKVHGDNYKLLGTYKSNKDKVLFEHISCGKTFKRSPSDMLRGQKCPYCYRTGNKDIDIYKYQLHRLGIDNIVPVEDVYKGTDEYLKHKCLKCNTIWSARPTWILHYHGCPYCAIHARQSKGEAFIERYLKESSYAYEYPKSFRGLKDIGELRYDFYLPDANTLIEYQGQQHYKPVEPWGGETAFKKQQVHDRLKRGYAISNNIKLLELPYTLDSYTKVKYYLDKNL